MSHLINKPTRNLSAFLPLFLSFLFILIPAIIFCHAKDSVPSFVSLKRLSLEELMEVEVMSVSKRPQKLIEVALAIQVITQKDIRNPGAGTPTGLRSWNRLIKNWKLSPIPSHMICVHRAISGFTTILEEDYGTRLDNEAKRITSVIKAKYRKDGTSY
jgi:hypothetical protein